jgi:disulfide bond formation protein DsbB
MTGNTMTAAGARPALLVGIAGVGVLGAALAGAWAFQILGDMAPCPLCLQQRWPYYAGIPLALAIVVMAVRRAPRWAMTLTLAAFAALMLWSAGMGVFHAGVEWKWWPGPTDCAAAPLPNLNAGDLLASMRRTRVVACDDAAWRFYGTLSLAGFNALFSVGLLGLSAWALSRR